VSCLQLVQHPGASLTLAGLPYPHPHAVAAPRSYTPRINSSFTILPTNRSEIEARIDHRRSRALLEPSEPNRHEAIYGSICLHSQDIIRHLDAGNPRATLDSRNSLTSLVKATTILNKCINVDLDSSERLFDVYQCLCARPIRARGFNLSTRLPFRRFAIYSLQPRTCHTNNVRHLLLGTPHISAPLKSL
jgi:hypothetical protein